MPLGQLEGKLDQRQEDMQVGHQDTIDRLQVGRPCPR